jgi:hypothetical protein
MFSGDGRAVDRDEGLARARTGTMDEPRQHFLAGAGLADDQHRAIGAGDTTRQVDDQTRGRVHRDGLQRFLETLFAAHLKPQHI